MVKLLVPHLIGFHFITVILTTSPYLNSMTLSHLHQLIPIGKFHFFFSFLKLQDLFFMVYLVLLSQCIQPLDLIFLFIQFLLLLLSFNILHVSDTYLEHFDVCIVPFTLCLRQEDILTIGNGAQIFAIFPKLGFRVLDIKDANKAILAPGKQVLVVIRKPNLLNRKTVSLDLKDFLPRMPQDVNGSGLL